jgi:hypothetical protein
MPLDAVPEVFALEVATDKELSSVFGHALFRRISLEAL